MVHIIVVGGGIMGMLTARELIQADFQVTLVERGQLARESSWAGGGILSPLYPWRYPDSIDTLAGWSQIHYPKLCQSLHQTTGIDAQFLQNGMLIIGSGDEGLAQVWARKQGRRLELISRSRLGQLEPGFSTPADKALWLPEIGQVRNPRLVKALAADIHSRGARVLVNRPVSDLKYQQDQIVGVKLHGGEMTADAVVICTGAWLPALLPQHLPKPEIRPVRGQMLLFKAKPGLIQRIVLENNRYAIPRADGRILFGSTLEDVGFDKSTTESAHRELYALAIERFPALKHYPVERHWAGLRPGSPAGVPYIAAHPQINGLYVNAGHFRNGVVLGPASARLITDIITGTPPIVPIKPYTLDAPRN